MEKELSLYATHGCAFVGLGMNFALDVSAVIFMAFGILDLRESMIWF